MASPARESVAHRIPLPAALPLADSESMPPGMPPAASALLCALAADRTVADFALNIESFDTRISTANYVGRINPDNTIDRDHIFFARDDAGRLCGMPLECGKFIFRGKLGRRRIGAMV